MVFFLAMTDRMNWAENYRYGATAFYQPTSVDELCEIVRRVKKIKALGTRHSFNAIGDSEAGAQISLEKFNAIEPIDADLNPSKNRVILHPCSSKFRQ